MLIGRKGHLNNEDRSKAKTSKATSPKEQQMKLKTKIAVIALAVAASTILAWSDPGENHTPTIEGGTASCR